MAAFFRSLYDWILRTFWATELDITVVGLQNAGKTSLLRILSGGEYALDSVPTVGFSMKRVQRGHVTLKCWDLGGQPRFRQMWERYCRGVNAIVFVVDLSDSTKGHDAAKAELHALMRQPSLAGIPLLVLGNKADLDRSASTDDLIQNLDLAAIENRQVDCYNVSAKEERNLEAVIHWLMKWSRT